MDDCSPVLFGKDNPRMDARFIRGCDPGGVRVLVLWQMILGLSCVETLGKGAFLENDFGGTTFFLVIGFNSSTSLRRSTMPLLFLLCYVDLQIEVRKNE